MLQSSGYTHDYAHDSHNDREYNCTHAVIRECVEYLRSSQHVEAYQHDIIRKQKYACEMICHSALAKGVVFEIADVHNGRVLHDELVHRERGDVEENCGYEHGDDTRYPAEDRERP
jgi:hypothetical protein